MTQRPSRLHHPAQRGLVPDAQAIRAEDPIVRLAREAVAKIVAQAQIPVPRPKADGQQSSPQITELAQALVDTDRARVDEMIADLLGSDLGVRDLCLDHLAPAARVLGAFWERDQLQFADVSLATARIQAIVRTMPTTPVRAATGRDDRTLFAAVPGETHTLGVVMAADHFRRLGWDVSLLIGMDHSDICRRARTDDCNVIGLSCAGRHAVPALSRLIQEIRHLRPDMGIVLAGHIVTDREAVDALPQLDGLVEELDGAEQVLRDAMAAVPEDRRALQAS
ncbi:cobalamin B12-binding domain-containing protein [Jannaschia sp. CCS1]|uniref:cobalamin B12-binding domain-containing protein n=1 Tax=Jannaschia sp. (strain CCS1) TaxID=290400 RepID=UPI00140FAED7|nr:cobalamin B12-binding domain-containing protein [Jannaschia sp. CCS1]